MIYSSLKRQSPHLNMQPIHLAIGIFDGVHQGHRALLRRMIENAGIHRYTAAVLTFHPHPKRVLNLPNAPRLIYPIHQRCHLLRTLGCEIICVQPFAEAFASMSPEMFFDDLRRRFSTLAAVYVGEDYRFGNRCCGNTQTLDMLCRSHGIGLHVCPNLNDGGEKISSTRIRKALSEQSIEVANRLLGVPYHCIGLVRTALHDGSFFLTQTISDSESLTTFSQLFDAQRLNKIVIKDDGKKASAGVMETVPPNQATLSTKWMQGCLPSKNLTDTDEFVPSFEKNLRTLSSVSKEATDKVSSTCSESMFFHTCCELKLKDGFYRCTLRNKHGQQALSACSANGRIRLLSPVNPVFQQGACVLSFEHDG